MQQTLLTFIGALREAGLAISPAETLDASRALEQMGLGSRDSVREALALTLAKSPADKARVYDCFQRFFTLQAAPPPSPTRPGLVIDTGGLTLAHWLLDGDHAALQQAINEAADAVQLERAGLFTQQGLYQRRLWTALDGDAVQALAERLAASPEATERTAGERLGAGLAQLRDSLRQRVQRQLQLAVGQVRQLQEQRLRDARLASLEARDYQAMRLLIQRMAERLAKRRRRPARHPRPGRLDLGRTLRRNIAHDALLFHRVWRERRRRRPALFVVCDVSGSVAASARFLLLFLHALRESLPETRCFAFSSELGEVTDLLRRRSPAESIDAALRQWGGGATDYGEAFATLEREHGAALGARATLLVLGDARSNGLPERAAQLREWQRRGVRILWLNPEAPALWGTGDSVMPRYRPCCHRVWSCRTLEELERAMQALPVG